MFDRLRAWLTGQAPERHRAPESQHAEQPCVAPLTQEQVALLTQLHTLLSGGWRIEAIKLYRDMTGVGLKEAKETVEALVREAPTVEAPRITPLPGEPFDAQMIALVQTGQKIEAIKRYREATGVGLKEAKEAVEALARQR